MQDEVCFVQMPFSTAVTPSLALSLLKGELTKAGIGSRIEYANLRFLKLIGEKRYILTAVNVKNAHMAGEFVFTKATGLPFKHTDAAYYQWLEAHRENCFYGTEGETLIRQLPEMISLADEFLEDTIKRILQWKPKIVACASTFFQVNSTIALFKRLKELAPGLITVIGGANCMGTAGIVLTNEIDWIDYAFSGEADECFARLCQVLIEKGDMARQEELPYGTIKKGALSVHGKEIPCRITKNMDGIAIPDFTEYFTALKELALEDRISPGLPVEFSRGCWWGEKRACSFCGLNGKVNQYRAKANERVLMELQQLADQYQCNDFVLTDNILSHRHLKELVPELEKYQHHFFTEIKSNLKLTDVRDLHKSGFYWLQPGIESLHDEALKLMNKGNKAIRHVELLKNFKIYGIHAFWNIIGGFPQEREEWFSEMLEIIEKIKHFQPPNALRPMVIQRYNEYWKNPEKYELQLRPAPLYDYIYPDLPGFIENVAYQFVQYEESEPDESENITLNGKVYQELKESIAKWNSSYVKNPDRLDMKDTGATIEIMDLRKIAKACMYTLTGIERDLYQACEGVVKIDTLVRRMKGRYTEEQIKAALKPLVDNHLILRINDEVLALAVEEKVKTRLDEFPGRYKHCI